MNRTKNGYLELVIGPMYAGKSSEIFKTINRFESINKNIFAINHIWNTRYESTGITSHSGQKYENCTTVEKLADIDVVSNLFLSADVIIIEELQFFSDATEHIIKWCDEYGKYVLAVGLSGDFLRKPFESVANLIPHADKILKIDALCKRCSDGTCAPFSKKIIKNDKTMEVGGTDMYEAVCRKHYLET